MLHRLALRVLPQLTSMVTERAVRKRKRLVMFLPGLVAFPLYRLVKLWIPMSEPVILLLISGIISGLSAIWAYRVGRCSAFSVIWKEDGLRRVGWLVVWIGFVYGVQLSLMVLALLKVFAGYDFLRHPDGPAMMAIIIACTSVARDAFEIGHVRLWQSSGRPLVTFPDGQSLWHMVREQPQPLFSWALIGLTGCPLLLLVLSIGHIGQSDLFQLATVTLAGGILTVCAYLAGKQQTGGLSFSCDGIRLGELFRFWTWPGLAFAATYYLVGAGIGYFIFRVPTLVAGPPILLAGLVMALLGGYGYYLGTRRWQEDRVQQTVPESLLRCPFVMGILSRTGGRAAKGSMPVVTSAVGDTGLTGRS